MATEKKAPEEQEAVQAETTEVVEEGKNVYTFKKPLVYNNKTYEKLTYDLDSLTGQDSMDVEEELVRLRKGIVIEGSLNTDYIIRIFCKANIILRTSMQIYNKKCCFCYDSGAEHSS